MTTTERPDPASIALRAAAPAAWPTPRGAQPMSERAIRFKVTCEACKDTAPEEPSQ